MVKFLGQGAKCDIFHVFDAVFIQCSLKNLGFVNNNKHYFSLQHSAILTIDP